MKSLWNVRAGYTHGSCRWNTVYRVLGLVSLIVCGMAAAELATAQDERAIRRIVVADRQTAQEILQQLRQGASFSVLARAKSAGPEYSQWGYSGTIRPNEVQPAMRTVLLKLKEGQVSDVLELGGQFVIIKMISPKIPRHLEAAERAERQGKLPQAMQELQAVLRLEEDNMQAYLKLSLLQQSAKKFDDAIRSLEKAQQYAPQEAQVVILLASAYTHAAAESHNAAQAEKALQAYQRVLQLDGRYAPAVHFGMGKVYLVALRQPDTAIGYLEKAAESTTNVAEVHRLLIQAYYDIQRYEQAWQSLRRAQDLGFDFPDLLAALQKVKQQSQRRQ
jgi:tetratricopeptide (TPR) repeat protein